MYRLEVGVNNNKIEEGRMDDIVYIDNVRYTPINQVAHCAACASSCKCHVNKHKSCCVTWVSGQCDASCQYWVGCSYSDN
jgi:hypothetical protein